MRKCERCIPRETSAALIEIPTEGTCDHHVYCCGARKTCGKDVLFKLGNSLSMRKSSRGKSNTCAISINELLVALKFNPIVYIRFVMSRNDATYILEVEASIFVSDEWNQGAPRETISPRARAAQLSRSDERTVRNLGDTPT